MHNEEREAFYDECSKILNIPHQYKTPVPRRTRWNNRLDGNGRYVGFGLIRCYGSCVIVTSKHGTKKFEVYTDVYTYLKELGYGFESI